MLESASSSRVSSHECCVRGCSCGCGGSGVSQLCAGRLGCGPGSSPSHAWCALWGRLRGPIPTA
eukprot:3638438-Alexandrium_andersonii.AAC.1